MVASKHRSSCKIFRKCPKCLWLESGVLAGKGHSITAPFLRVFSGHSKRQDILFSQPLVFPEMALTLLFDNKNVNRLWRVEFLLLILSNSWTLSEQLRFCLHIQQDTVKEAICPQINYFILHCFCGAKWMRCPVPPTSLLKPSSYCVRLVTAISLNCRLLGNFSATTFSRGEPLVSTQMKKNALTSWSFNFSLDCL